MEPGSARPLADLSERIAALAGASLGALPWRGLVRVEGPDAADFLQRILACDLRPLSAGDSAIGCLLDRTGKVVADFHALRAEEGFLLEVEASCASALARGLEGYRFAERVEIAEDSARVAWFALLGREGERALDRIGLGSAASLAPGRHAAIEVPGGLVRALRADALEAPGWRLLGARGEAATEPAGLLSPGILEYLRIRAGIARCGLDFDADAFPDEVGLEAAVSFKKGCFPGQEVVARIRTYGKTRRRLALLRLEGEAAAERGDAVERGGEEVGRVTSAASAPALGPPLALAMLRREAASPGAEAAVRRRAAVLPARIASLAGAGASPPTR